MGENQLEPLFIEDGEAENVLMGRRASVVCIDGDVARCRCRWNGGWRVTVSLY